jgi:attachment invasion locus protein
MTPKIHATTVAVLLLAGLASSAQAQQRMGNSNPKLYGEIGLSQLKIKAVDGPLSAEAKPGLLSGTIGYQFLPWLAVEGFVAGGVLKDEIKLNGANTGVDAKVPSVFGVFLKPTLPIGERVELFGRVGVARSKLELQAGGLDIDDSGSDVAYGLGLNVNLSPMSYLQANWTSYYKKDGNKIEGVGIAYGRRF